MITHRYAKMFKLKEQREPRPIQSDFFIFYKDSYDKQIERKRSIDNAFLNTLGAVAFLSAFYAFYLLNWLDGGQIRQYLCWYYVFAFVFTVAIVCGVACIYFLAKFYWIGWGEYLDTPDAYRKWRDEDLAKYGKEYNLSSRTLDRIFFDEIERQYSTSATHNQNNNNTRSAILDKARRLVFVCFGLLSFAFIPYFIAMGDDINTAKIDIHKFKVFRDGNQT